MLRLRGWGELPVCLVCLPQGASIDWHRVCTPGEGQEEGYRLWEPGGTSTLWGRGVGLLEWRKAVAGTKAHRQARKPENKGWEVRGPHQVTSVSPRRGPGVRFQRGGGWLKRQASLNENASGSERLELIVGLRIDDEMKVREKLNEQERARWMEQIHVGEWEGSPS